MRPVADGENLLQRMFSHYSMWDLPLMQRQSDQEDALGMVRPVAGEENIIKKMPLLQCSRGWAYHGKVESDQ